MEVEVVVLREKCLCLALSEGLIAGYLTVVVSNKIDLTEASSKVQRLPEQRVFVPL